MGAIHKLKPEVFNFILENKQKDSALSCRSLTRLILEKFQIKVSKSSINSIFKEHNLSMPIGRRQKHKKTRFNMPILPVIEGPKAIVVVRAPESGAANKLVIANPPEPALILGAAKGNAASRNGTEFTGAEEKRLKEAEEWAVQLQDAERARVEQLLNLEKQKVENDAKRKTEELEVGALLEEAEKKRLEEGVVVKCVDQRHSGPEPKEKENNPGAAEILLPAGGLQDEQSGSSQQSEEESVKKIEEEKAAQEAGLKAEKEKWTRLAEEELKVRRQEEKTPQERICSGAVFLKALDYLIGGGREINAAICRGLGASPEDYLNLTEALMFRSLSGKDSLPGPGDLAGRQYSPEQLDNYYGQIKGIESIKSEISRITSAAFTEARGVKVHFIDGSLIHLDGQLHSAWSTQYVPYDFSSPASELKNNLNKYFFEGQSLVLFSAPGYDIAPKDFFTLLLNIGSTDKYPDNLILFGNKLEEIAAISLNNQNKYSLIFGLWPWQFTNSRKVKKIGDFDLRRVDCLDKDLYLAEIEIDLLGGASLNQSVTLKGCAIKTTSAEKIRLVVLGSPEKPMSLDELAGAYLDHWPNFEEAFQDFSRKIEIFSYTGGEQKFLSQDRFEFATQGLNLELGDIFANYVKMLDLYLRRHFLPAEYIEKDLSFTSKHFYKLPARITAGPGKIRAKIQVEPGYEFRKDLKYLVCRFNERQIALPNGARLYFENIY